MTSLKKTAALVGAALLTTAFAYGEAPCHVRRFPKTIYLAEIPLNTTYGNGNTGAGWTGR